MYMYIPSIPSGNSKLNNSNFLLSSRFQTRRTFAIPTQIPAATFAQSAEKNSSETTTLGMCRNHLSVSIWFVSYRYCPEISVTVRGSLLRRTLLL